MRSFSIHEGGDELDRVNPEEVALIEVLEAIRAEAARPPAPSTRRSHLAMMTTAAAEHPVRADAQRRRSTRRLASRLAAVGIAVPLSTAGLAVAGVALPQPANDAFDAVGIELPNQSDKADPVTPSVDDGDSQPAKPTGQGPAGGTSSPPKGKPGGGKSDGDRPAPPAHANPGGSSPGGPPGNRGRPANPPPGSNSNANPSPGPSPNGNDRVPDGAGPPNGSGLAPGNSGNVESSGKAGAAPGRPGAAPPGNGRKPG